MVPIVIPRNNHPISRKDIDEEALKFSTVFIDMDFYLISWEEVFGSSPRKDPKRL